VTDFAHRLARVLADRSDTLFGVPGGGPNLDLVGAATDAGMRFILAHDETAAAIMASTYGLLTGRPSGVVVTRGPGATAVANGAAQATLDRYPLVVITDTVTAAQQPRISHQRFDQRALFQPITVGSITASASADLGTVVDRAGQWPLGAVHLDYDPTATADQHADPHLAPPAVPPIGDRIGPAVELLMASRRPVVIVGMEAAWLDHQSTLTGAEAPIRRLVEELGCPVLTSYQAIGLVATEGRHNAGLYTNGALEQPVLDEADLIVMIGVDTVEPIPTEWRQTAPVITISATDPIDAFVPADVTLIGDLATMAHQLVSTARHRDWEHTWQPDAATVMRADARRALRPESRPLHASTAGRLVGGDHGDDGDDDGGGDDGEPLSPVTLVDALLDGLAGADQAPITTVDAGAHFLAVMPRWPVARPFDLLISNGLATMGFAVPAAIGAALANPGRPVLALCGDGGLSMTMAELETIARLDLPVTVVVFNDSALSLIAVKQQPGHGGDAAIRYGSTDFATIGRASGLEGFVADSADDVRRLMSESWIKPRLIDTRIDPGDYRHLIVATRG